MPVITAGWACFACQLPVLCCSLLITQILNRAQTVHNNYIRVCARTPMLSLAHAYVHTIFGWSWDGHTQSKHHKIRWYLGTSQFYHPNFADCASPPNVYSHRRLYMHHVIRWVCNYFGTLCSWVCWWMHTPKSHEPWVIECSHSICIIHMHMHGDVTRYSTSPKKCTVVVLPLQNVTPLLLYCSQFFGCLQPIQLGSSLFVPTYVRTYVLYLHTSTYMYIHVYACVCVYLHYMRIYIDVLIWFW